MRQLKFCSNIPEFLQCPAESSGAVSRALTNAMTLQCVSLCVCATNRLHPTLQEAGGEQMSIWRIQSTTPDGFSNTFWEKVSAALFKHKGSLRRQITMNEVKMEAISRGCRNQTSSKCLLWSRGIFLSFKDSPVALLHCSSLKLKLISIQSFSKWKPPPLSNIMQQPGWRGWDMELLL